MSTTLYIQRVPRRLSTAVLLSLLAHALLLSVAFSGQTFGLPGLNLPWKERRLGANDLRILLAPAVPDPPPPVSAPAPRPPPTSPIAGSSAAAKPAAPRNAPLMSLPPPALLQREVATRLPLPSIPAPTPTPPPAPPQAPAVTSAKLPDVVLPIAPDAPQTRAPSDSVARDIPTPVREVSEPRLNDVAAQKLLEQDMRENRLEQTRLEQETLREEELRAAESIANAQREAARQEQLRQDAIRAEQNAKSEAAQMEAEREALARQEAQRVEQARRDAKAQQDAARQERERAEAARLAAARIEATRQEQAKQVQLEAARNAQAQLEAARVETMRKEALQQEQSRLAQLEAARRTKAQADLEAARQDAARQAAARQEQAKQDQAQRERAEQEAKREERLRAIGEQLKAEAAQREAAVNRPSPTLPTTSSLRRGWLFGRADANADLVLYAEAMTRKIEQNMTFDMVREQVKQPHMRPTVTVAIRADGSVEKVTFEISSGVAAIDEAIRKVVASQAPYPVFPPTLARQYDVIEIRRTWVFDMAIRLQ